MKLVGQGTYVYYYFKEDKEINFEYTKFIDEEKAKNDSEYNFTIICRNYPFDVCTDDYGQCFYLKYYDTFLDRYIEATCGTYNTDFLECVCCTLIYDLHIK